MVSTPSTRRLSEVARHLVIPDGIVSSHWPGVRRQLRRMGFPLDRWQENWIELILATRADGSLACGTSGAVASLVRQAGKTHTLGGLTFALSLEFPGLLTLWSAHRARTHNETFRDMAAMAEMPKIKPFVSHVRRASGEEGIEFTNGSRILFGAREHGFGRGFAEVDVLVFDEAQILTESALEDMVPATNASWFGLVLMIGTPPRPRDPGEAFTLKRDDALSGDDPDVLYVETSADSDADLDDRAQWARANPSFPHRTSETSILRMRKLLGSDESFAREALGIWSASVSAGVIPLDSWRAVGDEFSIPVDRFALGVEVAPDLTHASVVLAGLRDDGVWHVELDDAREGVVWLVPYLRMILDNNPQVRAVVADAGGPVSSLIQQRGPGDWVFKDDTKVSVYTPRAAEVADGCASFLYGVVSGSVRHINQGQLLTAVSGAGKRAYGADSGRWVWSRRSAAVDITPVQAASLALIGAQVERVNRKPVVAGVPGGRRAVVL